MRRHLLAIALIIGAVFAAYANVLRNGFVSDDHVCIEGNPFVQVPANLKILLDPRYYLGTHEVLVGSRPVFLASLMVDRALWGNGPAGYHSTSVLLHAANSVWVYALTAALGLPLPVGLCAGLIFGLHPVQTEAVDVVSFRPDLLAAFFFFSALWLCLKARGRRPVPVLLLAAAAAGLFGLGLLSKEMAATLPAIVLAAELYFPAPEGRRLRLAAILCAFFLVACAFGGFWAARFRYSETGDSSSLRRAVDRVAVVMPTSPGAGTLKLGVEKGRFFPQSTSEWSVLYEQPYVRTLTMIRALAGYFRLLALPEPLVSDRAPVIVRGWGEGGVWLALAVLLLAGLYAGLFRRRHPLAAFGAAWCLTTLIPVANLIPLRNPVAERYLYIVTAGAAWAAAAALAALARRWEVRGARAAALAGALIVGACGFRTHARNADWRDERSLYLGGPVKAPQSSVARLSRAGILRADGRLAEAAREYELAALAYPDSAVAWQGLGVTRATMGDIPRATACFDRSLAVSPRNPITRFGYALFLARIGKKERAAEMYREALRLEPQYVEAWVNLCALYRDAGRHREARSCYEKAVALAVPNDPVPFYSFATLLEKTGDARGAVLQYRAALERDASFAPAQRGLKRLSVRLGRKREAGRP